MNNGIHPQFYSKGNTLSLISLHFISLCCHYYTYRDDSELYSGKTGISDSSIVVTLNDIPRESRLLSVDALVKEGYVLVGIPADL